MGEVFLPSVSLADTGSLGGQRLRHWLPDSSITVQVTHSFTYLLLCFWLCWVFVASHRLSLVVASGGYSLRCGVCGLLVAVAPLVTEQGLQGTWASAVVVPGS